MTFPKYDNTRPIIAIDSETALFGPGRMAPPASCWSFAWRDENNNVQTELLSHKEGAREVMRLLSEATEGKWTLAFQNGPYDFAVLCAEYPEALPLVRKAHEAGAIHDTLFAEQLLDIARGLLRMEFDEESGEYKSKKSYGLENLTRIYLNWPFYKDEWRMRYAELRDVAIADYPEAAAIYPKKDAEGTLRVAEIQRSVASDVHPHDPLVASLAHVCRTYMALQLVSCWGQEIDPQGASLLEACMREYSESFVPEMEAAGLVSRVLRGKKAGSLTKKKAPLQGLVATALLAAGHAGECPNIGSLLDAPADWLGEDYLTDGGASGNKQIKCGRDVLNDLAKHEFSDVTLTKKLRAAAGYAEGEKLRTSFGTPMLQFGAGPLHSRYGLAETGRTTCSGGSRRSRTGFNVQQLPRKLPKELAALIHARAGVEMDVRSVFTARPGWVMSSSDFSALEACTFAQACIQLVGHSSLAEALNNDVDPHSLFASDLLGVSYEDTLTLLDGGDVEAKEARQRAKVANFGFPGGMGARKFLKYAKAQGIVMSFDESKRLHELYRQRWPEALDYFALAAQECNGGSATYVSSVSDMVSGDCMYTDWCNRHFQERAAFGATSGLWQIVWECYDASLASPLLGSRVTAFIHDEYLAEHPAEQAHEAAERLADVAREVMQNVCPDVKIKIEPALMERWWKAAKTVRDDNGRLQIWAPEAKQ